MTKYKVGDVAALFSKPKDPTTDSGKKLQSLFQDFYSKKTSVFKHSQNETHMNKDIETNRNDHRVSKKGKKRKFSSLNDSKLSLNENASENNPSKKFKESPKLQKNKFKSNEEKQQIFIKQQDSPQKKFKKSKVKSFQTGYVFSKTEASFKFGKSNEPYVIQKDDSRSNKQNSIKKTKYQHSNNSKLSKEMSLDDTDSSIRKEVEEFMKNNSEKTLKIKDNDFNKNPQKKTFNWKEKHAFKKSKLKTDLSIGDNLEKNIEESSKQNESVKNTENRKSTFLSQQDFPRTKKAHKMNSFGFSKSFSENIISSENDLESSAKSKKMKSNKNIFKQNLTSKVSNWQERALTKSPDLKSEKVFSKIPNDNSPSKYNLEITNTKDKQVDGFSRKLKKKKSQKKSFNKDDSEKSEELLNSNVSVLNAGNDLVNNDTESNKLKFNNNSKNKNSQIKIYEQTAPDFIKLSSPKKDDEEVLARTLFVGNLPAISNRKALKNLFSTFGEIEFIRYKGLETDKARIFSEKTNKLLSARYAADSVPGFIVFKDKQSAVQALSLSGSLFKGHHITVDFAVSPGTKKLYDEKRSIFIGNLPFDIKDETIWNTFMECGRIEAVRAVRDHATGIGKGFGYVLFSTVQAKENALGLNNLQMDGRTIRIKAVDANKKTQKSNQFSSNRDTFKSRAIRFKKRNTSSSRKTIKKLMNKEKTLHKKKKIASILQKSMK